MLRFCDSLLYKISALSSKQVMRIKKPTVQEFCSQCIWDRMKKALCGCKEIANTIQSSVYGFQAFFFVCFLEGFLCGQKIEGRERQRQRQDTGGNIKKLGH